MQRVDPPRVVDGSSPATRTSRIPLRSLTRGQVALAPGRQRAAWLLTVIGLPVLCWILVMNQRHLNLSTALLLNVSLVVVIAVTGGLWPGLTASILSVGLTNWFLTPPAHTLAIENSDDVVALISFVAIAIVVSLLVNRVAQRSREADRARAEAEALARTTGSIVGSADPLPALVEQLRDLFEMTTVMVLDRCPDGWTIAHLAGAPAAPDPALGRTATLDDAGDHVLVLVGGNLSAGDLTVVRAFTDQVALGLEAGRLRREAADADALAKTDELRTALLRSVSHDLRTPLASIKASVSGLLEPQVAFSDVDRASLLNTIDTSVDRLDQVVGDLLDMSRLQAGAVRTFNRPTALEELVAAALDHLDVPAGRTVVDVSATLPLVDTDGALMERAIGNVVSNALAWSPSDTVVIIDATEVGGAVRLRIVDRGPGIAGSERERVFEPFQRAGDRSHDAGAGLGLAIARGFVEATGAALELDDTPGGGATFTFALPVARGCQ